MLVDPNPVRHAASAVVQPASSTALPETHLTYDSLFVQSLRNMLIQAVRIDAFLTCDMESTGLVWTTAVADGSPTALVHPNSSAV